LLKVEHGILIRTTGAGLCQSHGDSDISAPHGIFSNLPYPAGIEHRDSCLKDCHDWPRRACINVLLQVSPQEEILLKIRLVTEGAMKLAIYLQSIFLDKSRSATAEHTRMPHSELEEFSLSEITICTS
jgi:hypothetical protein